MDLIILKPGVYNDARNKAHRCEAGSKITTSSVYGRSLINDGYARMTGAPPDVVTLVGGRLPHYVVLALRARGLRTMADVAEATDEELLTIRGIGTATLRKIRGGMQ